MGALTRQEMEQVIARGESVVHNGAIHWQVSTLPSEADLAGNDTQRLDMAGAALQDQIDALQREQANIAKRRADAAKFREQGGDAPVPVTDLIDDQARLERQAIIDSQQPYRDEAAAREEIMREAARKVTDAVSTENAELPEGNTPVGREIGTAEAVRVAAEQLAAEGAGGSPANDSTEGTENVPPQEPPKEAHPRGHAAKDKDK